MNYLKPNEYEMYADGATEFDVMFASRVIDAYLGKEIKEQKTIEKITLSKHGTGRMEYSPVIDIISVSGVYKSKFGVMKEQLPIDSIDYTNDGFFEFINSPSVNFAVFGLKPTKLVIEHTYGYKEVPEDIKVVCGIIARNRRRNESMGGFSNAKQVSSLDFNVVLFDDSIISSNERMLLNKYKDV